MFGYLIINKPELKVKEYDRYREYYCGVCHALKSEAGSVCRLSLSFDMTFLAMILTGLYEPATDRKTAACPAHLGKKMAFLSNESISYAADMNMLLTYFKCIDDWHDEKSFKARAMQLAYSKGIERVKNKYPEKVYKISKIIKRIWKLEEQAGEVDEMRLDDLCVCSGRLLECVFDQHDDIWSPELRLMGFSLGKFVYLLDAYDDLKEDNKRGLFNPLRYISKRPDFEEWIKRMLLILAADATAAFERLPVVEDAEIMRNILYAGIWTRFYNKDKKDDE